MTVSLTTHCAVPSWLDIYPGPYNKDFSKNPDAQASCRSKNKAVPDFSGSQPIGDVEPDVESDVLNTTANASDSQSTSKTEVAVSNRIRSEITITTVDGDTVTLNTLSLFEKNVTAYSRSSQTDENTYTISAGSAAFSFSSEFSLSVEGQLDKEELRDVSKAIRQVNKIVRRLFSGDMEHALKRAEKLHKLDSLSGIEALIQASKSVSVTQQTGKIDTESIANSNTELPAATDTESPTTTEEESEQGQAA